MSCDVKNGLRCFRPGPTQIRAVQSQRMARGWIFGFMKKRNCTIHVAKTKVLISCVVTASLVLRMQKSGFSQNEAQII